ncbi:zinc knuckle CX2CX4HX4C containing protein [Tanacetum coccineum]|uniref:Zinc knuckle CX2CX4HX4C containing protein n=1 Tax=Tanacetum coccineum TaxID=301880 RepID=A0ABQ5B7F4_9ASTR
MSKGALIIDDNSSVKASLNVPNADDNLVGKALPSDHIVQSVDINTSSRSYARAAGASAKDQPKVISNFRPLVADPVYDGVNISIPRKVIEKVSTCFEHTLYGYFIGKRLAFPVVEYYARNNWGKHGLKRIMMNNKGFFFFKFDSRAGLEAVLEGGPWIIRKSPIILKKWSMGTSLLKEELTRIPIWVKLHDVPLQVFEEDGISLIATFIGKPVMLDSYTSSMCKDSWGRSSFARCSIEVNSEAELVDVVTIGIPSLTGDDFTKETIRVEYEWRPPRYDICKIFGHVQDQCPKQMVTPPIVTTSNVVTPTVEKSNDGFQTVSKKKKRKGKSKSTNGGQFAEKEVENVYDESANLYTKTVGSSSFTVAAGLMQNLVSSTPYVPPSKKDYDILCQPLFEEYFQPPSSVVSPMLPVAALLSDDTTVTPSSTKIVQNVPSVNTSPTTQEIQSLVIRQDPSFEESSSQGVIPSNLHQLNQSFDNLSKWSKDHPLENVIGNPSRPVSTSSQLQTYAIW